MQFKKLIHTLGFLFAVLALSACTTGTGPNASQNSPRPYHAKPDTIACMTYANLKYLSKSMSQSDYATVNTLVQQKACCVLPTDQELFIVEFRDNGEIVNARIKDDPFTVWVLFSNLY